MFDRQDKQTRQNGTAGYDQKINKKREKEKGKSIRNFEERKSKRVKKKVY